MSIALHSLLFLSGAAGLIYEVCWSRQLGLLVGHGERGAAVTLSLFFAGMAAGYAIASRLAPTTTRPLRAYAACEFIVAVCALFLPTCSGLLPASLWLFVGAATVAMGATLPFVMQALAGHGAANARGYAVHLLGATAGSLLTTFLFIEQLGVWGSSYAAAGVSLGCATLAHFLANAIGPASEEAAPPAALRFQFAAAVAGATTLALEVLVLRLFALTFHNSTYTFGLTISVFIVCLALGSRWASLRLEQSPSRGVRIAGVASAVAAIGVSGILPLFATVTRFGELRAPNFASYVTLALGLTSLVLALPVIAAGAVLPALFGAAPGPAGAVVGGLSAANCVGAAAGALAASFMLLPRLGLLASLTTVAATYAALGLWLVRSFRFTSFVLAAMMLLSAGGYRMLPAGPAGYTLLQRFQSSLGWVDLLRDHADGSLSARLDLHYQLGSSRDRARHLGMGSLPLAMHPWPQRTLFVGLATGMTASAALGHASLRHIEIVALIPEVAALARRFAAHNDHVLDDPRVRLVLDDGRTHLSRGRSKFDVIVADLFVPWHSYAGYFYTVEHYRAVSARLETGGLFVQWLPIWQLGPQEFGLICASFAAVFPKSSAWLDDTDQARPLLALVSHAQDTLPASYATRARRLGRLRPRAGAALNSDEYPLVELRAPRSEREQRLFPDAGLGAELTKYFGD